MVWVLFGAKIRFTPTAVKLGYFKHGVLCPAFAGYNVSYNLVEKAVRSGYQEMR